MLTWSMIARQRPLRRAAHRLRQGLRLRGFTDPDVKAYARDHSALESDLLVELVKATHSSLPDAEMLSGREAGRLLTLLARLVRAESIVEIGTFSGYSALCLAEGMVEGGRLISFDVDPEAHEMAQRFIDRSPWAERIELRTEPALQGLESIEGPIDLAFIDADKANYPHYYEAVVAKLRVGGLVVVDNALWSGRVIAPADEADRAIDTLNQRMLADERVHNVLLTVRDGVHVGMRL